MANTEPSISKLEATLQKEIGLLREAMRKSKAVPLPEISKVVGSACSVASLVNSGLKAAAREHGADKQILLSLVEERYVC